MVIAILAVLASLLLPALTRAKQQAQTVACLSNLRQLQTCWIMYADDNAGRLPPNDFVNIANTDSPFARNFSWCPGEVRYDTTVTNLEQGLLFPYNRNVGIYKCPSDKATVQTRDGTPLPQLRNRSYNMSGAIGCEGTRDWIPGFYRFPEIIDPPPAKVFVFIDVHEKHIMDAHFGIYPPNLGWPDMWIDIPAERHRQGANLSFADGHVEHWRWEWPKQHPHVASFVQSEADRRDLRRLQSAVRQRF